MDWEALGKKYGVIQPGLEDAVRTLCAFRTHEALHRAKEERRATSTDLERNLSTIEKNLPRLVSAIEYLEKNGRYVGGTGFSFLAYLRPQLQHALDNFDKRQVMLPEYAEDGERHIPALPKIKAIHFRNEYIVNLSYLYTNIRGNQERDLSQVNVSRHYEKGIHSTGRLGFIRDVMVDFCGYEDLTLDAINGVLQKEKKERERINPEIS